MIIVCPGQGAQAIGMGKVWADASSEARAVFDTADSVLRGSLGAPLSDICFTGPAETLNRDRHQPAGALHRGDRLLARVVGADGLCRERNADRRGGRPEPW